MEHTMESSKSRLPPAPQTGRIAVLPGQHEGTHGLWLQLLAVFRDLSGAFDPFANDADPQVRFLGRLARQRRVPDPNDYFALGDLCARLTACKETLSGIYAAKTIAAYVRAGEIDPAELAAARVALLAFAFWVAETARSLKEHESLHVGLLVCERIRQLGILALESPNGERFLLLERRLREQQTPIYRDEQVLAVGEYIAAERVSQLFCERGQMLLRQNQTREALACFEQALKANQHNHVAWVWQAMALTDLGRFDQALASYDRALMQDPCGAGVWNSKGALLLELGQVKAALACFERALGYSAGSDAEAFYWLNKGKALYMLGHYQEAHDALIQSYQLDPSPESAAGIEAARQQLTALDDSMLLDQGVGETISFGGFFSMF